MNEEHKDQQLDAAYRRASTSDAGRPEAKTRAAILAEAAAQARKRAPAANDSRYMLSAVAGIAVIGVGLLLWRQTDHRLPGEAPSLEVPVAQETVGAAADSTFVPDPEEPPAAAVKLEMPPQVAEESSSRSRVATGPVPEPEPRPSVASAAAPPVAVPPAAPPPPAFQRADIPVPPPESPARSQDALSESRVVTAPAERSTRDTDERLELEEVQVTGSRVQREPRRTVGPRGTVPAPENDAPSPLVVQGFVANASLPENLLRQHFPAQYQSDTSHRLWIAREADGSMVRSGELAPGLRLEDALPGIGQALGGRRVTRESVHALMNARGQAIELNLLLVR